MNDFTDLSGQTQLVFKDTTIRATYDEKGTPVFCAKDVATVLGYADTVNAIKQHCRGVAFHHPIVDSLGRTQKARFIGEGDMYRLIAHSKLPSAVEFEKWIFEEVLPLLRKHGGYLTPEKIEEVLLNPDTIISLANQLKDEQAKVKELTPKAGAWETFCRSSGDMSGQILLKRLRPVVAFCALIIGGLVGVVLGDVVEVF
jgi:prophage antirepressor|nr:MAG TPA: repressor domain protein [Caudoviricetes sp.]